MKWWENGRDIKGYYLCSSSFTIDDTITYKFAKELLIST